ncbi:F-box only protein 28 isoform X2 [Bicyclus anynana]|uniref:F-box only protein 28 isoform X2 n=1 Tax=Bicyclus anynana TaxID=110368 RepID=A0A6J1NV76_BICAN|nr:F-box only protein 28 isoform X2 [Bicyclus anynana]
MTLLSLPELVIEYIFSYLSYDEIAKNRLVSKEFNEICKRLLNRGFVMIEKRHASVLKNVKAQLPRRESERRYHPLARHCDILTSIETRISMLNMTYMKFIDNGICSFIPGKVIDEIRRVLTIVESSNTPPRAHEVLQELRDISSMAIEHFDDKISPAFRKQLHESVLQPTSGPSRSENQKHIDYKIALRHRLFGAADRTEPRTSQIETDSLILPVRMREEFLHMRRRTIVNSRLSLYLTAQYKKYSEQVKEYKQFALRQHKAIRLLTKRQRMQSIAIAELKKRLEESDIKYTELSLSHTNQTAGGKAIPGASSDAASGSQSLRNFGSQIKLDLSVLPIGTSKKNQTKATPNMKPRKPRMKVPSLSEDMDSNLDMTIDDSMLANIYWATNKIQQLSSLGNMAKNFDGKLKRRLQSPKPKKQDTEAKKAKLD